MSKSDPIATEVLQRLTKFKTWLKDRGAEVLEPTNEYELVRFRVNGKSTVIYRKKEANAKVSFFCDVARTAWKESLNGSSTWRAMPATVRHKGINGAIYNTLRARDGNECFYCAEHMDAQAATIEHLVALCHGGPEHISNKFLAHGLCNQRAGNLSAVEKLQMYHYVRMKKALAQYGNSNGRPNRSASSANYVAPRTTSGNTDHQPRAIAQPVETQHAQPGA